MHVAFLQAFRGLRRPGLVAGSAMYPSSPIARFQQRTPHMPGADVDRCRPRQVGTKQAVPGSSSGTETIGAEAPMGCFSRGSTYSRRISPTSYRIARWLVDTAVATSRLYCDIFQLLGRSEAFLVLDLRLKRILAPLCRVVGERKPDPPRTASADEMLTEVSQRRMPMFPEYFSQKAADSHVELTCCQSNITPHSTRHSYNTPL